MSDRDLLRTNVFRRLLDSSIPGSCQTGSQISLLTDEIKCMLPLLDEMHENSSEMMITQILSDVYSEADKIVELYAAGQNSDDRETFVFAHDNYDSRLIELEVIENKIRDLLEKLYQIREAHMSGSYGVVGEKLDHSFSESEGSNISEMEEEKVVGFKKSKAEEEKDVGFKISQAEEEKVVGFKKSEAEEEKVVGFEEEVNTLLGKLHDSREGLWLEIISIIGAAGGGKTTLAREVYEHRLTSHTFEIRAWVNVSQEYETTMKRNLLITILDSASTEEQEDYDKFTEDELGEQTLNCLKGKKYLIVMDDVWGGEAWNDIQRSFPDEYNGSKVLFTSRLPIEPNRINCVPHYLAPLTKSCSWELLQKKVFKKKCCPPELVGIGEHIAEKCQGLPLAIVAVAGILVDKEKTFDVWKEFSKCLSSIIAKNQNDCMKILELSYDYLPPHLKACFVYIGGFAKDSEILIRELIWLWIAEGLIRQNEGGKSLEDVAKDYLGNLIDRNLVMVARKRFGGIKACCIHSLLHELCLQKAEKDNFLVQINRNGTLSPFTFSKHCGLFSGNQWPSSRYLRSFRFLSLQNYARLRDETILSSSIENLELLRVLHFISSDSLGTIGTGHLINLRYLAIHLEPNKSDRISPFFGLPNLETLYVQGLKFMTIPLPCDIDKMINLRHLCAKRVVFTYHPIEGKKKENGYHDFCLSLDRVDFDKTFKLDSLQTLHSICPCEECRYFLTRTLNLRKLGFYGVLISKGSHLLLPDLEFLECLETLSINHRGTLHRECIVPPVLMFPPTLMRLTFRYTFLKWEQVSIFQTLPSLEVLKLSSCACLGPIWNASELEGFSKLKYLQLHDLDIEEWYASEDQFPRLEVLVVKHCKYLWRIPIAFVNLNELREIEVRWSRRSAMESAWEIQEERRKARGDDGYINILAANNKF